MNLDAEPRSQPSTSTGAALPVPPPAVSAGPGAHERRPKTSPPPFSPAVLIITLVGQCIAGLVAGLGTITLSSKVGMAPERALAVAGTLAILAAGGAGFLAAAVKRKVGTWEVLCTGLVFCVATTLILGRQLLSPFGLYRPFLSDLGYLASMFGQNPMGGVGVATAAIFFATFIGGSLGYLLAGSGKLDLRFSYEAFIARSHLRLRKHSATRIMTGITVAGVALGVFALTVVLSVMSGFELDLKGKIIGTNAHAVVLKYGNDFKEWREAADKVRKVPGVVAATPFILNEVMVSSDQNLSGALIKGIDPETVTGVTNLGPNVKEGSLDWLNHPEKIAEPESGARLRRLLPSDEDSAPKARAKEQADPPLTMEDIIAPKKPGAADSEGKDKKDEAPAAPTPGILIGKELAHSLKVMVGDRLNVVSPLGGELGPTGPMPKSRPFRVAGIFVTGMYEYDAKFAYISLREAQTFFNVPDSVTGLEIKTDDIDDTRQITRAILSALDGYPYRTKDWGEMNKNLFSALRLEKLVMAVLLGLFVLVACFGILSTLIMMVLEKRKEISILKSMGATDTSVMKVFVLEGLIIGIIGTAAGLVLGYLACLLVDLGIIQLDAEVYYIDKLPVKIDALQFAIVALIAVTMSYLATIYPATRASRVAPVDGLRNE
ncbi:MAG TPA: ABC transporter permease [Myxococcales bacterium]|jgi:lipoprotein-releasing system permease protein